MKTEIFYARKLYMGKETKICQVCNRIFNRPQYMAFNMWEKRKYCSVGCYGKTLRGKPSTNPKTGEYKKCESKTCKNIVYIKKWQSERGIGRYCSRECFSSIFPGIWKNHLRGAMGSVYHALKKGKLIKPKSCSKCGREVSLYGHHYDYNKRLDVRWLCGKCHKFIHMYEMQA